MMPISPRVLQLANEYDPELWKRARADIPTDLLIPNGEIEIINKLHPDVRDFMLNLISSFMEFTETVTKILEEAE